MQTSKCGGHVFFFFFFFGVCTIHHPIHLLLWYHYYFQGNLSSLVACDLVGLSKLYCTSLYSDHIHGPSVLISLFILTL